MLSLVQFHDIDFQTLTDLIEKSDVSPTGETLAEVYGISDVKINDSKGKRGYHKTVLGIPTIFYYTQLPASEKSLFISFHDVNETKKQEIEEIIQTVDF